MEREKSPPMTKQQDGQSVQDLIKASIGDYEARKLTLWESAAAGM